MLTPPTAQRLQRRLPIGAEVVPGEGVSFRVWAPRRKRIDVVLEATVEGDSQSAALALAAEADGYFAGIAPNAAAGTRYGFCLDGGTRAYPDPASRWQPDGPHELSAVVDPAAFVWTDQTWRGIELAGQVIYEMHVGTFTAEGTWAAAMRDLPRLAELGITTIELMPVAEFAGSFGWGYDGVDLFAPTRLYGTPDELRRFVDMAHTLGLGVMLDVVYNHFGPQGNYLSEFSSDYVSGRHHTDWGDGIHFDGENCAPVREFFLANAGYWIDEFHIDGLRLDAVHAIVDDSEDHIVAAIARRVAESAGGRGTLVVAEDEFQDSRRLRGGPHGRHLDAAWNDDFHHAARVAMTGHNEYYYGDYQGTPQELISAIKWGYLYQGQWNARQQRSRGRPALDVDAARFVIFLQNHDQVGNTPLGRRCHELTSPGRYRAMTALWALAPGTPLVFQGQEFAASSPFFYFADHETDLAALVREGRHAGLKQFRRQAGPDAAGCLADPCDPQTFLASKLDASERFRQAGIYDLHRDLFRLRREDAVFSAQRGDRIHGAVLAPEAFFLRYLGESGDDRLLLINLGRDLEYVPAADPLLAPPADAQWRLVWSSEDPRYGGSGTGMLDARSWYIPGHTAIVLGPQPATGKAE
jgi:maltooligosyltrehalose trehalohydrolase